MTCAVFSGGCVKVKDKGRVTELRRVCEKQNRLVEFARYGSGLAIFDTDIEQRAKLNEILTAIEDKIRHIRYGMLTTTPTSSILALMEQKRTCVQNFLNSVDPKKAKLFIALEKQRQNLELELEINKTTDVNVIRAESKLEREGIVFIMNACCIDLVKLLYLLNPESFEIQLSKEKIKGDVVLDKVKEQPGSHKNITGETIIQLTAEKEIKLKKGVPSYAPEWRGVYLLYEDITKGEAEGKIDGILKSIAYKTNDIFKFHY